MEKVQTNVSRPVLKPWQIIFAALFLVALYFFIAGAMANQALRQDLARLKTLGVPTTVEEIPSVYPSQGENAEPYYQKAFDEWDRLKQSNPALLEAMARYGFQAGMVNDKPLLEKESEYRTFLSLLGEATKRPRFVVHYDFRPGLSTPVHHHGHLRAFGEALRAIAVIRAERGDLAGSLKALRYLDRLISHTANQPMVTSLLVSLRSVERFDEAARVVAATHRNNANFLAELLHLVENRQPQGSLRHAFLIEPVAVRASLQQELRPHMWDSKGGGTPLSEQVIAWVMATRQVRQGAERKFVRAWVRAFQALPADESNWRESHRVLQQIETEVEADKSISGRLNSILWIQASNVAQKWGEEYKRRNLLERDLRQMLKQARAVQG